MPGSLAQKIFALAIGLAATASWGQAQTDEDIWPAGAKGVKTWPRDYPNDWSKAPNWTFPEGGDVPPDDLFERIKCPSGTSKLTIQKAYSTAWELSRWHPPQYAFDKYNVSRWSSNDANHRWFVADLGSPKTIKSVYLIWETAFATAYDLKVTNQEVLVSAPKNDSDTAVVKFNGAGIWTTIKQVTGGNGKADVVEVEGEGRFLQMYATAAGSPYGYSFFECTICGAEPGTGLNSKAMRSERIKSWSLVVNPGGLPQGVRAYDVSGKSLTQAPGRKLPFANIYIERDAR